MRSLKLYSGAEPPITTQFPLTQASAAGSTRPAPPSPPEWAPRHQRLAAGAEVKGQDDGANVLMELKALSLEQKWLTTSHRLCR